MMKKDEATECLLEAKAEKGLTFADIEEAIGADKVWLAAAIMGQASVPEELAEKMVTLFGLGPDVKAALMDFPMKGCLDSTVPVDPLIYRFYEIMQVYGTSMKAVIHEMFGDGIMSAIDFEIDIAKQEDPKGDRVVVTLNGKFLPYRTW